MSTEYKDWYNDFSDHQKEIYNICIKYPFLIPRDIDGSRDEEFEYEYLCLEIPIGWRKLFLQMCSDIKPLLEKEGVIDDFYFLQVKEKYNELTCYSNGVASLEVGEILQKYRYLSRFVCTECGKPALYEANGYLESFCKDCWEKNSRLKKGRTLEFIDTYEMIRFGNGEKHTYTVSVEDEWNRYLKENSYDTV